jgi:hypothetical protein
MKCSLISVSMLHGKRSSRPVVRGGENLNVGHLMLLLQFGNMKKDLAKYNTQLFAARVMPQLGDVFSEWEDRWWPKPMERSARAPLSGFQPATMAAE